MAKAASFKKGEQVIHIARYNDKGKFVFQRAVVNSCGKKQMTLSDATTGEMMGRNFCPVEGFVSLHAVCKNVEAGERPAHHFVSSGTFKDMSDEDAMAMCLKLSAEWIAYQGVYLKGLQQKNAHLAGCAAHLAGYVASLQKSIDKLGEPLAASYANRMA